MRCHQMLLGTAGAVLWLFSAAATLGGGAPTGSSTLEAAGHTRGLVAPSLATAWGGRPGFDAQATGSSLPVQGASPFGIAITRDGQYAYLTFDLSEDVFKIRLSDFAIVGAADLTAYFPSECEQIALDPTEQRLFVYTPTWRTLIVIDTASMGVVHTIRDYPLTGMFLSRYGARLVTWDGGGVVRFIDTSTFAVTQQSFSNLFIDKIEERTDSRTMWNVAARPTPGGRGPLTVGTFDHAAGSWQRSVSFSAQGDAGPVAVFALKGILNEDKVYVGVLGGWYPENHSYGWLYAVDLTRGRVNPVFVDGGVLCLEASADGRRLYVGTGWPVPKDNNLLVVDTQTDAILGRVPLERTKYRWPHTQMNTLRRDPADANVLYATSADGNSFTKVRLDRSAVERDLVLNREDVPPQFFARRPGDDSGLIMLHNTASAVDFNAGRGLVNSVMTLPVTQTGYYDAAFSSTGRLFVAQGQRILELSAADMSVVATHPLPQGTPAIWQCMLSSDERRLYSVVRTPASQPGQSPSWSLLAIDTATFQQGARIDLAGGPFMSRPFEVPDRGKLYVLGGLHNGAITVDVIETAGHTWQKRIVFDQPGLLGIVAGPAYPFAFDAGSHTLFVGATQVVLGIDTQTDTIRQVIRLGDSARVIGLQPSALTYVNAAGLVYSPRERVLYIAHADRSYVSIYDVVGNRFLERLIPLKAYGPSYVFANQDFSAIYSLNGRSDSISVISTITKTVERVIDLQEFVPVPPGPGTALPPLAGSPR